MRRAVIRIPAHSKYRAKPITVDGHRFASQKEARRYSELRLLEKAGYIQALQLQPVYTLEAAQELHVKRPMVVGVYRADFAYYDMKTGLEVVEDVKGFKTPLYRWKKKHVEAQYGIQVREL